MALARWSAMILALPTVTAFGVVSTGCVESPSEMLRCCRPKSPVGVVTSIRIRFRFRRC